MTENIAVLWDSVTWEEGEPSEYDRINQAYKVFSEVAEARGGKVYMANYGWYSEGALEKAFTWEGEWRKVEDVPVDVVFDKFDFSEETRPIKEDIARELPVINAPGLEELAADKLESYRRFPGYVPETLDATEENVERVLEKYGRVVVKPRSDWGGEGVEVIDDMEGFAAGDDRVAQRFVDSSRGIPSLDVNEVHDLRIIILNSDPVAAQVRVPDSGLISNIHRGGDTFFVGLDEVPEEIVDIAGDVAGELSEFEPSLYSIDFIFDPEGEPWILELNSKPGLLFYGSEELEERKKEIMEELVEELLEMA